MTPEQIEKCQVTTETILLDLSETEAEIRDLRDELDVLQRNPQENKVRIYLLEGRLGKRNLFIQKLNSILFHRGIQR